jgi:hypothetical protein
MRKREYDTNISAESRVAEIIGLEAGMTVLSIIAVGYPAVESPEHPPAELPWEHVRFDQYGKKE